jgi:hypothetical protein
MATRGRKKVLEDSYTTCVTIENRHREFLSNEGKEVSVFLRESIEALMRLKSSPIEQMKKEIEEREAIILQNQIIISQLKAGIQKMEELKIQEIEERKAIEELEVNRRKFVIESKKFLQTQTVCFTGWVDHLVKVYKFENFKEAKEYVRRVWLEIGVPEKRIKEFLMLN